MKNKILLFAIFLSASGISFAQDNTFSQFFANRIYLNPAFAGIESGLQVSASARSQWLKADGGYKFAAVAVEWQEPCWQSGFGLTLQGSLEGLAPMTTTGAGLTYARIIPVENGNVHVGIQYSYNQLRLDLDRLTFSDELDPVFGLYYPTAATLAKDVVTYHDFGFGALWRFDSKLVTTKLAKVKYRSHIGLSIQHLASLFGPGPDISFQETDSEIPARITLHFGTIIPITFLQGSTHKVVISPNFRLETQGFRPFRFKESFSQFSGGLYFIYEQAILGAFYHNRSPFPGAKNTTSLTLSFGFTQHEKEEKKRSYYLGVSVDANASGLGIRSGNVYEVNFRYTIKDIRPLCEKKHPASDRKTVMECKDFY